MNQKAYSISNERLDRRLLWSRLWLLRLAAWIVQYTNIWAPLDRALHALLAPPINKVEKLICKLIAAKAVKRLRLEARPRAGHNRSYRPTGFIRTIIGARLRKLCRVHDLRGKISALLALIDNAESEIARFARRCAKGLTRRRGGTPQSAFALDVLYSPQRLAFASADTS